MADSSTDGSANTAVIPILAGQTCIGELLPEIKDLLEPVPSEWGQPDADGAAGGQLRLF